MIMIDPLTPKESKMTRLDTRLLSIRMAFVAFALVGAADTALAQPFPDNGRFNLRCPVTVRTMSGPPAPKNITVNFAIDFKSQQWCLPDEGCPEHYTLQRPGASSPGADLIELVVKDDPTDHEKALINLATGKLAGSYDDAPRGLINGFRTYLLDGQCSSMAYSEHPER